MREGLSESAHRHRFQAAFMLRWLNPAIVSDTEAGMLKIFDGYSYGER